MREMDYSNAIPVTRDIHWIGYFDEEAHLHCNPYLLIDDQDVILFDPGSIPHFPIVMRKVIDLVNPTEITALVISHQDPDVCGNLAVVEDVIGRDDLQILCHSKTLRLIRHYGLKSKDYVVDEQNYTFRLSSGRELKFIPTPYLHSPEQSRPGTARRQPCSAQTCSEEFRTHGHCLQGHNIWSRCARSIDSTCRATSC